MRKYSMPARRVADLRAVFGAGVLRSHFETALVFHVEQQNGFAENRLDLMRIEHVKQDHLIAPEPQRLDSLDDRFGLLVKIG
jgi:hypothetical protein